MAIVLSVITVYGASMGVAQAQHPHSTQSDIQQKVSRQADVRAADSRVDGALARLSKAEANADAAREQFYSLAGDPVTTQTTQGRYARALAAVDMVPDDSGTVNARQQESQPRVIERVEARSAVTYVQERMLGTQQQLVNAKQAVASQQRRERAVVAKATRSVKKRIAATKGARKGWVLPLPGMLPRISSDAGFRMHPILNYTRCHAGADVGAATGTPVRAASAGTVARVGFDGGYGNVVYLQHPGGQETRYAHLSETHVKMGQRVAAGAKIGDVGSTGLSTGPHLHFEIRHARTGAPLVVRDWYAGRSEVACDAADN